MFDKWKHLTRSLSHSEMGVNRRTLMSIRIGAKKNYKKFNFLKKKEKIWRRRIILVEDAISPKVGATSCPSYGLPKLR